jgi:Ser/Thr protein kinase RdoA (MazF antagonist)
VEHLPSRGSIGEGEFALSVVDFHRPFSNTASLGTKVFRGGLSMTKDASFKKVVRRHAEQTGQRYTEALKDLEGLGARMDHVPAADRLLTHLRDRYGIDAATATKLSMHATYVFRIDRNDGDPWIARAFHPARPMAGAEGDAAILRFLERQGYPAERLAVDDAVSDFEGSAVLVTRFVDGEPMPKGREIAIMGDLLGRLHVLRLDESASRPGGAVGDDPSREGAPRQDLLAALSFLDAVDTKVGAPHRERFEQLRDQVRSADDAHGLPEALVHGCLLASPDHVVVTGQGPVAINWKCSGRGPRLSDFAFLMWGTWLDGEEIDAGVNAYRRHVELTDEELDRLEAVMRVRPLYLMSWVYRRHIERHHDGGSGVDWKWFNPDYIRDAAAAIRAAFHK